MVGSGIAAFPYGFALAGYAAGPLIFSLIAFLSYVAYKALIECTITEHVASYGALFKKIPKVWFLYANFALWWLLILATTSYVLIGASMIKTLFVGQRTLSAMESFLLRDKVLFGLILVALFPVCLVKSFHGLSLISTYCSCAVMTVVGLIVWKGFEIAMSPSTAVPSDLSMTVETSPGSLALCVPIFGTAMFGHMSMSQIYAELQPKVKEQANRVALAACVGCSILYVSVGFAGYAAFGREAHSDVVSQIVEKDGENTVTFLMQFLLLSYVMLKTPLMILPLRNLTVELASPGTKPAELAIWIHVGITVGLLATVYLALTAMPNLGTVLEILGATCVIPLAFVVPARLSWTLENPRPVVKCAILAVTGVLASGISLLVWSTS